MGELELVAGRAQHGRARDREGGEGARGRGGRSGQTMRTEALFWHLHTQCLHHDTINQANFIKQLKL